MKYKHILDPLIENYSSFKNHQLYGRYITSSHLLPEMDQLPKMFFMQEVGKSVLEEPIHSVTFGKGPIKVLAWSQMHGNESTTTKAMFDLFNLFGSEESSEWVSSILKKCTIKVIPMLNPDGAIRYTRENVNEVDLNRDARNLEQNESRVLRTCFDDFEPDFCFNLHDQRTIFSAGDSANPATLSFLAPAMDESRSISGNREKAMQIIAAINEEIQGYLKDQIGRYDDAFNLECTGDTFQVLGAPTILFEAGHYQNDYLREKTRKYMAIAIVSALLSISGRDYEELETTAYFEIPENRKNFFDVILRNVKIGQEIKDVALQFEEKIKAGKIDFDPVVQKVEKNLASFGHREIDCEGNSVEIFPQGPITETASVQQILLKNNKLSIKTTENL